MCSGLHVTPNIPPIEGLGNVPIAMHSSDFKERSQFGVDKDILIVGSGETGMDIAHLAVTSDTKSVTLCHRDGFHCAPKASFSIPLVVLDPVKLTEFVTAACSRARDLRDPIYLPTSIERSV